MKKQKIIVSGLPGRVATQIAETVIMSENYMLAPIGFSGKKKGKINILGKTVKLFPLNNKELPTLTSLANLIQGDEIIVDFSPKATIEKNIEFYSQLKLNYVIGTSGLNSARIYGGSVYIPDILQESIYSLLDVIENNEECGNIDYYDRYDNFSLTIDRGPYIINHEFSKKNPFLDQGLRSIRKEIIIRDRQFINLNRYLHIILKKGDITTSITYPIKKDIIIANVFEAIEHILRKDKDDDGNRFELRQGIFRSVMLMG